MVGLKKNHRVSHNLIGTLIKKEFGVIPGPNRQYTCLIEDDSIFDKESGFTPIENKRVGTAYSFLRCTICYSNGQLIEITDDF